MAVGAAPSVGPGFRSRRRRQTRHVAAAVRNAEAVAGRWQNDQGRTRADRLRPGVPDRPIQTEPGRSGGGGGFAAAQSAEASLAASARAGGVEGDLSSGGGAEVESG